MATNNPLEILTYANLSNAAYGSGAVPMGWTLLTATSSSKTGFAAMAVRNEATGEIVIAYRGTDGIKDLTGSDLQLALQNEVPDQYPEAAAFYETIRNEYGANANITLTGHSLGVRSHNWWQLLPVALLTLTMRRASMLSIVP